jgi:hypothetical protein
MSPSLPGKLQIGLTTWSVTELQALEPMSDLLFGKAKEPPLVSPPQS